MTEDKIKTIVDGLYADVKLHDVLRAVMDLPDDYFKILRYIVLADHIPNAKEIAECFDMEEIDVSMKVFQLAEMDLI